MQSNSQVPHFSIYAEEIQFLRIHQEVDLLLLEPVAPEIKRLRGRGRSGLTVRHLRRRSVRRKEKPKVKVLSRSQQILANSMQATEEKRKRTSWTFNLVNYYVVMSGVAVVSGETWSRRGRFYPENIIDFLAGPNIQSPIPRGPRQTLLPGF